MTSMADREEGRMVAAGVDGSPESVAAARYAVRAAGLRDLDLPLVHAYELPSINVPVEQAIVDVCRKPHGNWWRTWRRSSRCPAPCGSNR
jgi:hypothetical protein